MIKTLLKFFKKKSEAKLVGIITKYFGVRGKVQNVMFRQTFIRGAIKRELVAGATNDSENQGRVFCILKGNEKAIENYVSFLKEKKFINSWGATVENIVDLKEGQS